jgi:hypothetical protein
MSATLVALIAFAVTFGAALAGLGLRALLPSHHVQPESQAAVSTAIGLVAAMTALVLGLVTASAQGNYSAAASELKQVAGRVVALDRSLAQLGPAAVPIRIELRQLIAARYAAFWPEEAGAPTVAQLVGGDPAGVERLTRQIRALPADDEAQKELRSRALTLGEQLLDERWSLLTEASGQVPTAFILILLAWLAGTFASFGLFAPRNLTVVVTFAFAAGAVSCALFLIVELNSPLTGFVKLSGAPLAQALSLLGR